MRALAPAALCMTPAAIRQQGDAARPGVTTHLRSEAAAAAHSARTCLPAHGYHELGQGVRACVIDSYLLGEAAMHLAQDDTGLRVQREDIGVGCTHECKQVE